jgi:predicted dehydrogenase
VVTAVGYHWRHLDTLERARELLADRPARLVRAAWLDRAPRVSWWAQQDRSGGQFVEQVTHLFDVARVLVGEVTGGSAVGSRTDDAPGDILEVATAALTFEGGAVGSFTSSCTAPPRFRIGIEITAPGLGLWLTETTLTVTDADGERTQEARVDPFLAEDTAFVAAVRGEGTGGIRCDYREALRTHRLAVAVATAAAEGRAVELTPTVAA